MPMPTATVEAMRCEGQAAEWEEDERQELLRHGKIVILEVCETQATRIKVYNTHSKSWAKV